MAKLKLGPIADDKPVKITTELRWKPEQPLRLLTCLLRAVSSVSLRKFKVPSMVSSIAAISNFLLTSEAGWITGQVIGVDGGRSRLRTKG